MKVIYKIEGKVKAIESFSNKKEAYAFFKKESKRHRLVWRNKNYASRDFYTYQWDASHNQIKVFHELEVVDLL